MLSVYINYPNQRIEVHGESTCQDIGKMRKAGQRWIRIDLKSVGGELAKFAAKAYSFGADASKNDLWLEVEFGDVDFEEAVVGYVKRLIGLRYARLATASVRRHCP